MSRAGRLIRKHGFLPGNGLEALVEEALSANAPDQSERVSRLERAVADMADALTLADNIISTNCGTDVPLEWPRALRKVTRARSPLNQDSSNVG